MVVECPYCGEHIKLPFKRKFWDDLYNKEIMCSRCGAVWDEVNYTETAKDKDTGRYSR